MMNTANTRVVVAMSGGVDSSVAAALLVEQGYDVVGIMLRLWAEQSPSGDECGIHNRCCTPDQMRDARRIADQLGIPFYVLDARAVFRQQIVQGFIDGYSAGVTPNPCLACNRHIRFTHLLNHALALGAQYLATGHYARVRQAEDGSFVLLKGVDAHKDQSYVLSVLNQHQLRHAMFPLGDYTKQEVRGLAARFGLPVASKHDSQDLCFLADGNYRRFLAEHAPQAMAPGPIMNRSGVVLGQHQGLPGYTIGQRKGLGISAPEPLYVVDKDPTNNTLIVGTRDELGQDSLTACDVNWIAGTPPDTPLQAEVKIRYKAQPALATIIPLPGSRVAIRFAYPVQGITPGQGAVFYQGAQCLGMGIIERPSPP